jgi:hypothetical protein
MKYLILCLCLLLYGCTKAEDLELFKEIDSNQTVLINLIKNQSRDITNLTKEVKSLTKEIQSIPKWK